MIDTGRAVLYLCESGRLTNWPGSLQFRAHAMKEGRHNIAGTRIDVWFIGPDGARWHGTQYGEWTQLCHCRRVKG
jgi:hypothetical protein